LIGKANMKSVLRDIQQQEAGELENRDEAWFYGELSKVADPHPKGDDFVILCPFHADGNPSCGVDRSGGHFNCWSCKEGGPWNKLAEKLGMAKLRRTTQESGLPELKDQMIRDLKRMGVGGKRAEKKEKSRPMSSPWAEEWRGFPQEFLAKVGCIKVHDLVHNTVRCGIPIRNLRGQLQGYTCRVVSPPDAEPKYLPLSADTHRIQELSAETGICFIDWVVAQGIRKVVVVEGPVDAMRLWQNGIPAVAILGTANWGPKKIAILLGAGIEACLLLMDQDRSGQQAQQAIKASLSGQLRVKGIQLPVGIKDPDLLTDEQFDWIRTRLETL
jgi:5S rRNA maturation endonuclease (ribonuclease M5)